MTRLNPLMTIGEHLADTLSEHRPAWQQAQIRERAQSLLQRVGISEERYRSYPHEFSGGMRQRLAIALAMALRPALVIADEPTTSLDVAVAGQVMQELCELCQEAGSALLLISHDLAMAGRWCDQIAVLDQGRLVEQAPAATLLTRPQSPLAQRLVGAARSREGGLTPAPSNAAPLLELEELRCWHPLPGLPWQARWYRAVDGVSLQLRHGETIGVVGASGCGKSTLCRALMGLTPVRGGSVKLKGVDLMRLRGEALRQARRRIQMVFQDPLACLNPAMTVGEAIADPLLIHGLASPSAAREQPASGSGSGAAAARGFRSSAAPPALRRSAAAGRHRAGPRARTGGAALRRGVSMLDAEVQAEVLQLLRSLQDRLGLGLIFVTTTSRWRAASVSGSWCSMVARSSKRGRAISCSASPRLRSLGRWWRHVHACPPPQQQSSFSITSGRGASNSIRSLRIG